MNSVTDHLRWMCDRLRAGKPFCHLRFNDGEAQAMGLVEGGDANCDGHRYFPDMGRALRDVMCGMMDDADALLGTIMQTDPTHPTAVAIGDMVRTGKSKRCRTTVGEFWCQEERVEGWGELQELFKLLRDRPTVLVCNLHNRNARRCLDAECINVPEVDAWKDGRRVIADLLDLTEASWDPTFVWACGFPGKVWAWMLKTLIPGSTHIDVGHTFDGVYGRKSREWMKRDSEMSRFYFGTFAPWVRSFER